MGHKRTQLVQNVVFFQGDSADEIFAILYPDLDGCSTGWTTPKSIKAAMDHLMNWDYGDGLGSDVVEHSTSRNEHRSATHIMTWDYSYGWVSLERKVTQKEAAQLRG